MKLSEIIGVLESFAPLPLQEAYDNAGLCYGEMSSTIDKILVSLDITEEVIEEAINKGCQLIMAHHPLIFKPVKKLTGADYVERTLLKAIRNNVALYTAHTNLDNVKGGVNFKLAEKIGLREVRILEPRRGALRKLTVYVPAENTIALLEYLGKAGAGQIGNYKNCSFRVEGIGTFMPNENASPHIGKAHAQEEVRENRVEVVFPVYLENKVLSAMYEAHPYEEVAFNITELENTNPETGSGAIGLLEKELSAEDFLKHLCTRLEISNVKYTRFDKKIKKVAVCGGAGSFLLKRAIAAGADAFVSSDFKYHEFFDAEEKIFVGDIGHYESEVYTKELFFELLTKNFPNIAVLFSTVNTNPVKYYN